MKSYSVSLKKVRNEYEVEELESRLANIQEELDLPVWMTHEYQRGVWFEEKAKIKRKLIQLENSI